MAQIRCTENFVNFGRVFEIWERTDADVMLVSVNGWQLWSVFSAHYLRGRLKMREKENAAQ